jgi:hypothetical protein
LLWLGEAPDDLTLPRACDLPVTSKRRQDALVTKVLAPSFKRFRRIHQSLNYQTPMKYESVKLLPN